MKKKQKHVSQYWNNKQEEITSEEVFDFNDFDSISRFQGSHPEVMKKRITHQNWQLELDVNQKKFSLKDHFLYWFEKATGIRLFGFTNYRILP
jgi:hypothetical protein